METKDEDVMIPVYTPTSELTFDILLEEIIQELRDEQFLNRTHGRPSTYTRGCRGHLCRYAQRTRQRQMRASAVKASLPEGVIPETRPRTEQTFDSIIVRLLDHLHDDSLEKQVEQLERMDEKTQRVS